MSLQDIRLWEQEDINTIAIGVFETYGSFKIKDNLKIIVGRQGIELDNGRLFSRGNWSQRSCAHHGVRLTFQQNNFNSDFIFLYNQNTPSIFGTYYS